MNSLMKKHKKFLLIFVFIFIFIGNLFASKIPALAGKPLHDFAKVLTNSQFKDLESKLLQIDNRGKFQMAILIIKELDHTDIETYAVEVFENWKLGKAGEDNGLLILVAYEDHKIRFEVGYGLEGVLTDLRCGKIIRNVIAPEFKKNNYYEGLNLAVESITNIIEGDESSLELIEEEDYEEFPIGSIMYAIAIIIFILVKHFAKTRRGSIITFGGSDFFFGDGGSDFFSGGGSSDFFSGDGGSSGGGGATGGW